MEKKLQMALILVSVILGVLCIILAVVLTLTEIFHPDKPHLSAAISRLTTT